MRVTEFRVHDVGRVAIAHNSDWSGEAIIRWGFTQHGNQEARLPGMILRGLVVTLTVAAAESLRDALAVLGATK